jgi:hypothetical protein
VAVAGDGASTLCACTDVNVQTIPSRPTFEPPCRQGAREHRLVAKAEAFDPDVDFLWSRMTANTRIVCWLSSLEDDPKPG